jgi:DUF4097 and DUF4098 domain-containing protein YvlB
MRYQYSLKTKPLTRVGVFLAAAVMLSCLIAADCDPSEWVGSMGGPEFTENFHKAFPLEANGRFSLKNTNGDIRVETWSKAEADISAVKVARGHKENLDKVTIETDALAGSVAVDTIYPKFRNLRVSVNYTIRVPEGVRLDLVRSTNGDVELIGRYGDVKASSTNGDIKLTGAAAAAEMSTTNGGIFASELTGSVDAHTTNGRINLTMPAVKGDIVARTTNGSISVRLGGEINAALKVHTTNGHIDTSLPVTIRDFSQSRRRLEGTIGAGGPLIDLSTTNGSVSIQR